MKTFCMGCGVEKGLNEKELYTGTQGLVNDRPIESLFVTCVDSQIKGVPWKCAVFCHKCFDRLDMDMWISYGCWKSLNPYIPVEELPEHNEESCGKGVEFFAKWYAEREEKTK